MVYWYPRSCACVLAYIGLTHSPPIALVDTILPGNMSICEVLVTLIESLLCKSSERHRIKPQGIVDLRSEILFYVCGGKHHLLLSLLLTTACPSSLFCLLTMKTRLCMCLLPSHYMTRYRQTCVLHCHGKLEIYEDHP
jgi:hypothetical protein